MAASISVSLCDPAGLTSEPKTAVISVRCASAVSLLCRGDSRLSSAAGASVEGRKLDNPLVKSRKGKC